MTINNDDKTSQVGETEASTTSEAPVSRAEFNALQKQLQEWRASTAQPKHVAPPPPVVDMDDEEVIAPKRPTVNSTARELAALKKELADRDAKLKAQTLDNTLNAELMAAGITTPASIKLAKSVLIHADKLVGYEGDEIVFNTAEGAVDLKSGLKSWLGSEEARHLIPAKGVAGAGTKPIQRGRPVKDTNAVEKAHDALSGLLFGKSN